MNCLQLKYVFYVSGYDCSSLENVILINDLDFWNLIEWMKNWIDRDLTLVTDCINVQASRCLECLMELGNMSRKYLSLQKF